MTRSEKETAQILRELYESNKIKLYFRTAEFNRIADFIVMRNDNKILLLEIKQSDAIDCKGLASKTLKKAQQIEANERFAHDAAVEHIYIVCLYPMSLVYVIRDIKPLLDITKTIISPAMLLFNSSSAESSIRAAVERLI